MTEKQIEQKAEKYSEAFIAKGVAKASYIKGYNEATKELQNGNFVLTVNEIIEGKDKKIEELEAQIEKMKADVRVNIKVADQSNNCLMYQKLNSMLNQWEGKRR